PAERSRSSSATSIEKLTSPDAASTRSGAGSTGRTIGWASWARAAATSPAPWTAGHRPPPPSASADTSMRWRKQRIMTYPAVCRGWKARSVRSRQGAYVGMNFGSHKALVAMAEPHQHHLARTQLGDAVAAQRLHVDEDVLGALAAGQETEPL